MVVKEDGTKWACQSCLKGHRVSGCTHTDRELTFVPKKGRPITQCPHCRSERKKRAAHVKCDCGDKSHGKEKCVHLREAEAAEAKTAALGDHQSHSHSHSPDLNPLPEESSADEHTCCCPHGGKCNCSSLKREPSSEEVLDPLPKAPRSKPRLTSHASEGHLTKFSNGHHKPCHRNNNAAHESGAPYKLPRAHSHTASSASNAASRSVDSLASVQSSQQAALPQHIAIDTCSHPEHNFSQSEQGSPSSTTPGQHPTSNDAQPSPPVSQPSYTQPDVSSSLPSTTFQDFGFPSAQSAFSVGTSITEASSMPAYSMPASAMDMGGVATDYWANIDWNNLIDNSMDNTTDVQPALTNASSGTMSEADDLPPVDDINAFDAPYVANTQAQMPLDLVNSFAGGSDYGVDFAGNASQSNRWSMPLFPTQNFAAPDDKVQQRPGPETSGTASPATDAANQPLPLDQFGDFQQYHAASTSDPTSSAQSPMQLSSAEFMYQPKGESVSGYSWDGFLPNYNSAAMSDNGNGDGSFDLAGSSLAQPAGNTTSTATYQDSTGYDETYGFDNTSKMLLWNDGNFAPAGQDFLSTYNFDQDFSTPDFNHQWTS